MVLREGQVSSIRQKGTAAFNQPDSGWDLLLTMSSIAGWGLNFHHSCSSMIIAELPINLSIVTQLIGRLIRTGQTEKVKVEILTVDRSFDHVRQGYMARKGLNVLAGTTDFIRDIVENESDGTSEPLKMQWIVEEVIRRELGQASSRYGWSTRQERDGTVVYLKSNADIDKQDQEEIELEEDQEKKRVAYDNRAAKWKSYAEEVAKVADIYEGDSKGKSMYPLASMDIKHH